MEVTAPRARMPIMALGMLALAGALAGGLARLGWALPAPAALVAFHGPLMVAGFLGTVIGMERAVAVGRPWAYAAPIASGLGGVALLAHAPGGPLLMMIASVVMLAVFVEILRRQTATFTAVMAAGAAAWAMGQLLWLVGAPVHRVAPWWAAFLVLTIAAERLEMTRLLPRGPATRAGFLVVIAVLVAGLAWSTLGLDGGTRIVGLAWIALAAWLGLFDVARRTVRMTGVPRFTAVALLSGYAWLAVGGALALSGGDVAAGPLYDAMLHAVFVGFVFSMIFGHAPIIIPAVLRRAVRYDPGFYAHLALLHASLALRITGDVAGLPTARQWGGLLNVLAILWFIANTAFAVARAGARPRD